MKEKMDKVFKPVFIFGFFCSLVFSLLISGTGLVFTSAFAEGKRLEVIDAIQFRETDIRTVIRSIAGQAYRDGRKVNIVTSPEVTGVVTIELEDVDWLSALEVVIRPFNYGYEWVRENTIVVDEVDRISERERKDQERQEVELPRTRVFDLNHLDANDAKKAIEPLLSGAGRATVLEITGQAGWEFGTDITTRERAREGVVSKTKVLIVSDTSRRLEEIENLIEQIDIEPRQILIKARIIEVREGILDEFGFEWDIGPIDLTSPRGIMSGGILGGFISSVEDGRDAIRFEKTSGAEFEAVIRALKKDAHTNILSRPTILTLDGQEASILIGQRFPIVRAEADRETGRIVGGSLDYYEDIGIQLNVIPQIAGANRDLVNMIIHPAIMSFSETAKIRSEEAILAEYPKIDIRQAQTQVLLRDGETIVIGGLLDDQEVEEERRVPFLSRIPILGYFFRSQKTRTDKIDLLISVTAHIIDSSEFDLAEK